jgi:peptidoglycan/LPS O-acetylase OafA/YrhL
MIQRIQTLWLLLAIGTLGLTFIFSLYQSPSVMQYPHFYLGKDVPGIILTAVTMLLSGYTLILFKNRKKQATFGWLSLIAALATFAYLYIACENYLATNQVIGGHYWLGLFMPLIAAICIFLGLMGIRKDTKLIKSLDRLR